MDEQTHENNPNFPAEKVVRQGTMQNQPASEPQKSNTPGEQAPERKKPYRRYHRRNPNQRRFYKQNQQRSQNQGLNLNNKVISVIVPLYNEEESVVELSIALKKVLENIKANYEVIFIDDGSTDDSYLKIKEINHLNNRFKCIKFKRNYGKIGSAFRRI